VIALAIVLSLIDFQQLKIAIQHANYWLVASCFITTLLWLLVRAMYWRTLLRERASYRDVFFAINEGYLLNNLLPFRLGELARAFLLGRKSDPEGKQIGFWFVFSSILVERILDMAFGVGILVTSLIFVVGGSWAVPAAVFTGSLVLVGLIVMYILARNQDWAIAQLNRLGQRWPILLKLGGGILPAFLSGLSVFTDGKRFLKAIGWASLNWVISLTQYYLMLNAFIPGAKLSWALFALGIAALGVAVPSSPGNIGVLEGALVAALAVFKVDFASAFAFAFTLHIIQYTLSIILGAYGLSREGETLLGLYQQLRNTKRPTAQE
jgi:glycosyltransferase 2 family protein